MATKKDEYAQQTLGWHVQSSAPSPYNQPGNLGSNLANAAIPVGVGQPTKELPNSGYADATAPAQVKVTNPTVPASGVLSPNNTGFDVTVVITGGTLTAVKVGAAGQTFAQASQEGTGAGTYVVPPNGSIGWSGSVAPTWTWTD